MRKSQPKLIGGSISAVLQQLGHGKKIKQGEVLDAWSRIVGPQIASVTTAEKMSGGKLFVRVARSTWRNELVFLKKEIVARINKTVEREIVDDIIFR